MYTYLKIRSTKSLLRHSGVLALAVFVFYGCIRNTGEDNLKRVVLDFKEGSTGERVQSLGTYNIAVRHLKRDAVGMNRIFVSGRDLKVELFPTKGLSVGQVYYKGRPFFWNAPVDLPDVNTLDLQDSSVVIDGVRTRGVQFLKTLIGGIELYGLRNWGMHYTDPETGEFHPLHGETSNIPVDSVVVSTRETGITIRGYMTVRDYGESGPGYWYRQGKPLYKVIRSISFQHGVPEILVEDEITNTTELELVPSIGYHITLYPERGCEIAIPSRTVENRSDGTLPINHNIWPPSTDENNRTEVGVIRKGLKSFKDPDTDKEMVQSLVVYPDGTGTVMETPNFPYYQSWLCSGGQGSNEFTDLDGVSLLTRNWDGIGIEFGSSALDHDGNIDTTVNQNFVLPPGRSIGIPIRVRLTNKMETTRIFTEIQAFNANSK